MLMPIACRIRKNLEDKLAGARDRHGIHEMLEATVVPAPEEAIEEV